MGAEFEAGQEQLDSAGLSVLTWYGVRVFTDQADADAPVPDDLELILECENGRGAPIPTARWPLTT